MAALATSVALTVTEFDATTSRSCRMSVPATGAPTVKVSAQPVIPLFTGIGGDPVGVFFTAASGVSDPGLQGERLMHLRVELEQEVDGRWIAEIGALPGVLVYGVTREEAIYKAETLALRVLRERVEHGEEKQFPSEVVFTAA
jgi:predicted RNase H-like HicB family nuclease